MRNFPGNQLSFKLLKNNRNLKMLELSEFANFLMILHNEPMVHYVKSLKKEQFKFVFKDYEKTKLQKMFYELDYYASKMAPAISLNKQ